MSTTHVPRMRPLTLSELPPLVDYRIGGIKLDDGTERHIMLRVKMWVRPDPEFVVICNRCQDHLYRSPVSGDSMWFAHVLDVARKISNHANSHPSCLSHVSAEAASPEVAVAVTPPAVPTEPKCVWLCRCGAIQSPEMPVCKTCGRMCHPVKIETAVKYLSDRVMITRALSKEWEETMYTAIVCAPDK